MWRQVFQLADWIEPQASSSPIGCGPRIGKLEARRHDERTAMSLLEFADKSFFVLHTALMLFNMFGWIWRRTRLAHLICFGLTSFSWFVIGWFHGNIGFCLCTQWHFEVRQALDYHDTERSYLQLLARHWFGADMSLDTAYWSAAIVYAIVLVGTVTVWTIDLMRRRRLRLSRAASPVDRSLETAVTVEPRA
jgi:hypothetical protein